MHKNEAFLHPYAFRVSSTLLYKSKREVISKLILLYKTQKQERSLIIYIKIKDGLF